LWQKKETAKKGWGGDIYGTSSRRELKAGWISGHDNGRKGKAGPERRLEWCVMKENYQRERKRVEKQNKEEEEKGRQKGDCQPIMDMTTKFRRRRKLVRKIYARH